MRDTGPVVVGIDELSTSEAALRWGIEQAGLLATTLRLVCAYRWAFISPGEMGYEVPAIERQELLQHAENTLRRACEQASALAPELAVESAAVDGDAVSVLLAESSHAAVLILGSRQLKTFGSVVLGSVAAAVSARAQCPVVVLRVPAGDPAEEPAVIVGVDGTEGSEAVIAFGFDYASRNRLPLKAVLCWKDHFSVGPWQHTRRSFERAEFWLSEALAGWREKYPDVEVRSGVIHDGPVPGLVADSVGQNLLVVGTRGRNALAGTLLGSVSQGVLHHALCPVAVVPSHVG
ncbi:MAG: universal stress protein [Jatrophihabitantaceae bacterium]